MELSSASEIVRTNLKEMSRLSWIFWISLGLILSLTLVFAFPGLIGAKQALIVSSGSMEPVIPTGSVIWVYNTTPEEIREGDVITFGPISNPDKEFTTHRVVNVRNNSGEISFITKGDANEDPDPSPVESSQLYGRHGITIPYLGYAIVEARDTGFFLGLTVVAAFLLIAKESLKVYREYRGMKKEKRQNEIYYTYIIAFSVGLIILSTLRLTSIPSEISQTLGLGISADLIVFLLALLYITASMLLLRVL